MRVTVLISGLMTVAAAVALPGRGRMHDMPPSSSMAGIPSSTQMPSSSSSSLMGISPSSSSAMASAMPSMLMGLDHVQGGFATSSYSSSASSSSAVAAPAAGIKPPSIVQTAPINTKTCPSGLTKQCCMSVSKSSKEITQPLGAVLPVGGVKLSSVLGISCVPMKATDANILCRETIMCCSSRSMLGLGVFEGCQMAQ